MQKTTPVLIVGAGPTGLTAAMELSRLGVPVRLIDRLAEFSSTSRALAVQARTLELFEQRGLAGEMLRIGNRGNAATIYGDGKQLGRLDFSSIDSRFPFILLLAQSETERLLREQLGRQGVAIERSTELIAFSQSEPHEPVTAVLRKQDGSLEEVQAAYLIAADGAHSTARHTLSLEFEGKSLPHSYALADLHIEGNLPEDQLSIFSSEHGLLAAFPMGDRRFRLIASEGEQHGGARDPDLAEMQEKYDAGAHIPSRLYDLVWSSRFRINSRMLHRLRADRVFFGGDSAHIHSPAGGQGMNTGIQDMINLCWKLALVYHDRAPEALLDTYERERLPVIEAVVSKTERGTDVFDSESPAVHTLLAHIAPLVLGVGKVRRMGATMLSETQANYRKSPLSAQGGASGTIQAGDRVPDLQVVLQTGETASLLDILNPSRFTLLSLRTDSDFTPNPAWAQRIQTQTITEIPEQAFGTADLVLVRPDGYVAFIGGGHNGAAQLDRWLTKWLKPAEPTR